MTTTAPKASQHPVTGDLDTAIAELPGEITLLANADPHTFADELVRLLKDRLELKAALLFTNSPKSQVLRLRAANGIDPGRLSTFDFPLDTLAGRSVESPRRRIVDETGAESLSSLDRELLEDVGYQGSVAVAIKAENVWADLDPPAPFASLLLVLRDGQDGQPIADAFSRLSPIVGELYLTAFTRKLMAFRSMTVERVAFKHDIGTLVHKFLEILNKELGFEAATVWVWDPWRAQLNLRGSQGLDLRGRPRADIWLPVPGDGIVQQTFAAARRKPLYPASPDESMLPRGNDAYEVHSSAVSAACVPSASHLAGRDVTALAVLAILNKGTAVGDETRVGQFSWEDEALIEFGSEMLAVLIYQLIRTLDHEYAYERRMHATRNSVKNAKQSVLQLIDRANIAELLPEGYKNHPDDVVVWLQDIEYQFNRGDLDAPPEVELVETRLYGDVLAAAVKWAKARARHQDVALKFEGVDELATDYRSIPPVKADRKALQAVFRNLIDNSVKYRRANQRTLRLRITVQWDSSSVTVRYSDDGFGIDPADLDHVFELGFRSYDAAHANKEGQGLGLYDARSYMKAMEGSIAIETPSEEGSSREGKRGIGTTFAIGLSTWEEPD